MAACAECGQYVGIGGSECVCGDIQVKRYGESFTIAYGDGTLEFVKPETYAAMNEVWARKMLDACKPLPQWLRGAPEIKLTRWQKTKNRISYRLSRVRDAWLVLTDRADIGDW